MEDTRIRVLVPSSERKRTGGSRAFTFTEAQNERSSNRFHSLAADRREALTAFLAAVNGKGFAEDVLRLKGSTLASAKSINLSFHRSPLLPVLERESGPFALALLKGLGEDALRSVREDLVFVCPLLGVMSPTDLVPEYRCPIGAQIPEWGSLHQFWKPRVAPVLNRLCKGRRVFSFLGQRLRALWDDDGRALDLIHVSFARRREDGKLLPENAGSARLAGELVRYLVTGKVTEREPILSYRFASGHRFAPKESVLEKSTAQVVFVRESTKKS